MYEYTNEILMDSIDNIMHLRRNIMIKNTDHLEIHHGQFPVLMFLSKKEGITQAKIADCLRVTPATVAISTKRMEKSGLINKRVNKDNRRENQIFLTDVGKKAVEETGIIAKKIIDKMFDGLSMKNIEDLEKTLVLITQNLEKMILQDK